MTSFDEALAHFGVKGMKWGVHRTASQLSVGPSADAERAAAAKKTIKVGGTKALSNAELQHLVTRLNLERQLKQINPSNKEKAARFAADLLLGVGKQQVTRIATDVAAKQVSNLLKKS